MMKKVVILALVLTVGVGYMESFAQKSSPSDSQTKIKEISADLEISALRIKQALGLPLGGLTAFEQAEVNFYNAPEGGLERESAALAWVSACASCEQVKYLSNFLPADSRASGQAFWRGVELAATPAELSELFNPWLFNLPATGDLEAVFLKWLDMCADAQQAEDLYYTIPSASPVKRPALEKWLDFVQLDDFRQFYEKICFSGGRHEETKENCPQADFRPLIMRRWSNLFLTAVAQAETYAEVDKLFLKDNCPPDEELIKPALQKYARLAKEEVALASHAARAARIYSFGPDDREVKEQALLKWIELSQDLDEAVEAFNQCQLGSAAEAAAIRKIYQMWR